MYGGLGRHVHAVVEGAGKILGDIAPTYFVSVAAIVAAFYAKEAIGK